MAIQAEKVIARFVVVTAIPVAMLQYGHAMAADVNASSAAAPVEIDVENIDVVGQRASLSTALEIKREKQEIVDSVVAEDINKLPDYNIAEALQRVTGVQITRDRGEGSTIAIRGLTQVETLFNGREVFTAGGGRGLNFADIPSEMVSVINVYKTSSAEHIEGGLGGMVDLRTHRPFDFNGREIVATGRLVNGDLADKAKPQFSLLASDRWDAGNGELGALINLAYQKRAYREDIKDTGTATVSGQAVPNSSTETTNDGVRERIGASIVLQWRPSNRLDFYAEAHHSQFKTIEDASQLFITGTGSPGSIALFPGTSDAQSVTWPGASIFSLGTARDTIDRTTQLAVGGNWSGDALTLKTDLSYTKSYDNLSFSSIFLGGATATSFTQNVGTSPPATRIGGINLLDLSKYTSAGMLYALRPFNGELKALQVDGEYQFVGNLIDTLSAGVRYAQRDATSAPGQISFSSFVPAANAAGAVIANPYSDFFPGSTSIGSYLVGDSELARNIAALRSALGITAAIPSTNPLGTWTIKEDTLSGFLMARIKAEKIPLDGNVGLRVVRTDESVTGTTGQVSASNILIPGTAAPINIGQSYTDFLPSMNLRYELTKGLYLRGAASKTLTRPDFSQMSPSLTLNTVQFNGSAGNPSLHPVRADNYDIALEKYISKTTAVYLTGFLKKVDGFIANVTNTETYGGTAYQVTRPFNTGAADITGFEVGYQQFYDFLPGWLSGLGLQANYTYIESDVAGSSLPLQGLSRNSYNIIGMYEKGPLSARLAYNWRDKYMTGLVGAVPTYVRAYGWLDASLVYRYTNKISLAIEGNNLLGTERRSYYGVETRPQTDWVNNTQISATVTIRF